LYMTGEEIAVLLHSLPFVIIHPWITDCGIDKYWLTESVIKVAFFRRDDIVHSIIP